MSLLDWLLDNDGETYGVTEDYFGSEDEDEE